MDRSPAQPDWQWAEALPGHGRGAALDMPDGRVVFTRIPDTRTVELRRLGASGQTLWRQTFGPTAADSAALLLHDGTLYAALYSELATGGEVVALEARTGMRRWATRLEGLGPLHHSKYRNQIQLRLVDGRLAVFGKEAAGHYIEVLEPSSGRRLSHRRVAP